MTYSSQRVVVFIGNLAPLFHTEEINHQLAARSLRDGTLIRATAEDEAEPEDAYVVVWWQGDPGRASEVPAYMMASNALVEYVRFHSVGKRTDHAANLLAHMSEHFGHKTGATLYLPYREEEFVFLGKVIKAAENAGPKLAWEVLKKGLAL
ncbi:hypothetical protein IFT98_05025 [Pseudomonas sp. CFBP 8770]|uniref:hypothetical protein n=1 Tax=unclassified Pseudomonas TaxID=196821 RepID=UPI001782163D|nr:MULTISPECIES: hypothetical protein [unclassified Pseudomonas]MBD8473221.1 hypothetical protein [Pseudomonas sp. CFBP 8773]MBD8646348.1 hypothetical protein [Pseudomonas sp. CFBP 8770]